MNRARRADANTGNSPLAATDRQFASGLRWTGLVKLAAQLFAWSVTVFVARILSPDDYGIVAAGAAFIGLLRLVTEFGLTTAIVARKEVSQHELDQLGGVALTGGVAMAFVAAMLSPLVATVLREPVLERVLPILSIGTAFAAVNAVPLAILQRRLRYRAIALMELMRSAVSSALLLTLAIAGKGYWSLVLSEIGAGVIYSLMLLLSVRLRFALPRLRDLREVLSSSLDIMGSRLAWYIFSNADTLIVSRYLGATNLGMYRMAWTLTNAPSDKLTAVMYSVTPGIFSRAQADIVALRRYFVSSVETLLAVVAPASLGLAIVAPDLIPLLIGDRWSGAIPVLQVLCLLIPLRTVTPLCGQVLIAMQRSRVVMVYSVGLAICLPLAFLFGTRFGVLGVAASWAIVYPPFAALQFVLTSRELGMPIREVVRCFAWPYIGCAAMAAGALSAQWFSAAFSPQGRLVITVLAGAITYGAVMLIFRRSQVLEVIAFLSGRGKQ